MRSRARTLRRSAIAPLTALTISLVALALPHSAPAQAVTLGIRTVPAYPGVTIKLGAQEVPTAPDGRAQLVYDGSPAGLSGLKVEESLISDSVRTRFGRWYGNLERPGQRLIAALYVDYRVRFAFFDRNGEPIDTDRISRLVLRGSHGVSYQFSGQELHSGQWLEGTRVVSTPRGPEAKDILYSVERVIVDGTNVVNRAQQRFFPATERNVEIQLLFFSMHIYARDAYFKFPIGSGVRLQHPNGRWHEYPFESNAEIVLSALPRGEYWVEVRAPGYSFLRPVSLSRDQEVSLEVVSYLDIALTLGVLLVAALGLLLIGRPHLFTLFRLKGVRAARAARRALLLCVLLSTLVFTSTTTAAANPTPVLAYYYIWFSPTSWNRAKTDYPVLGRYSSDERLVMQEHVRWAKQAGIDGFIVSWKSTPTLDRRLERLIEVAEDENFDLVIIYQGLDFARDPLPSARIKADLEHFTTRFADSPVFDVFGKPAVIWSGTWKFSRRDIEGVVQPLRDRLLVLASEKDAAHYKRLRGLVDGDAYYWPADFVRHPAGANKLEVLGDAVRADGGLWIAPASPGYDARLLGGRIVIPRRGGETLRAGVDGAVGSSPDAIGLISWNEFSENTHVEPSEKYGTRALEVLADIEGASPTFKGDLDSSDAADTPAAATGTEYGVPMLMGAVVLAFVLMLTAVWRSRRRPQAPNVE